MSKDYHTNRKNQEKNKLLLTSDHGPHCDYRCSHPNVSKVKKRYIPNLYTREECSTVPGLDADTVLKFAQQRRLRRDTWRYIPLTFNDRTADVINKLETSTRGEFVAFINLLLSLKFSSNFQYIYASRKWFADKLGVTVLSITRYIKRAKKLRIIDGYNVRNKTIEFKINTELYNPIVQRRFSHIFNVFKYLMTISFLVSHNVYTATDTKLEYELNINNINKVSTSNNFLKRDESSSFTLSSLTNLFKINPKQENSMESKRNEATSKYQDLNLNRTKTENWHNSNVAHRKEIEAAKQKRAEEQQQQKEYNASVYGRHVSAHKENNYQKYIDEENLKSLEKQLNSIRVSNSFSKQKYQRLEQLDRESKDPEAQAKKEACFERLNDLFKNV